MRELASNMVEMSEALAQMKGMMNHTADKKEEHVTVALVLTLEPCHFHLGKLLARDMEAASTRALPSEEEPCSKRRRRTVSKSPPPPPAEGKSCSSGSMMEVPPGPPPGLPTEWAFVE